MRVTPGERKFGPPLQRAHLWSVDAQDGHRFGAGSGGRLRLRIFCKAASGRGHSPTYGINAMKRARLTASLTARWKAAQLPERLRLNILPWLVQSFLSVCTSL